LTGAPETYAVDSIPEPISQAVDVWSLGCVLSEACTYVILGKVGIDQFGKLRRSTGKKNTQKQTNGSKKQLSQSQLSEMGCFHDGREVLEVVRTWHAFLPSLLRKSDSITGLVLELVDNHIFLRDPQTRIGASELYHRLETIWRRSSLVSVATPENLRQALTEYEQTPNPEHLSFAVQERHISRKDDSASLTVSRSTPPSSQALTNPEHEQFSRMLLDGVITREYIKHLYVPGDLVVSNIGGSLSAYKVLSVEVVEITRGDSDYGEDWTIDDSHENTGLEAQQLDPLLETATKVMIKGYAWKFDGDFRKDEKETIFRLSGPTSQENYINSLDAYPLKFADIRVVERLKHRGHEFWKSRSRRFISYKPSWDSVNSDPVSQ